MPASRNGSCVVSRCEDRKVLRGSGPFLPFHTEASRSARWGLCSLDSSRVRHWPRTRTQSFSATICTCGRTCTVTSSFTCSPAPVSSVTPRVRVSLPCGAQPSSPPRTGPASPRLPSSASRTSSPRANRDRTSSPSSALDFPLPLRPMSTVNGSRGRVTSVNDLNAVRRSSVRRAAVMSLTLGRRTDNGQRGALPQVGTRVVMPRTEARPPLEPKRHVADILRRAAHFSCHSRVAAGCRGGTSAGQRAERGRAGL